MIGSKIISVSSVPSCSEKFSLYSAIDRGVADVALAGQIRSGKHQPRNTIGQFFNIEVDQQSDRHIHQLHVTQQLRLVNGMNFLDGLCFNEKAGIHERVKLQWFLSLEILISNDHRFLGGHVVATQFQLFAEAPEVNRFEQSRPFVLVNFNRRTNNIMGNRGRLLVKRMHCFIRSPIILNRRKQREQRRTTGLDMFSIN